jgi:hypothetical protein
MSYQIFFDHLINSMVDLLLKYAKCRKNMTGKSLGKGKNS